MAMRSGFESDPRVRRARIERVFVYLLIVALVAGLVRFY